MKYPISPSLYTLSTTARCVAVASACCCAGLASAQSTVTLYGLADIGITQVTGLKAGSVTQVASGIMEGSRWGLKGNEDLGGGYRTIFTLESRVELDTGATSNRPITGSQLPDRLSLAANMGLPQATLDAIGPLLANEYGVNVGASGNRLFDRQAFVGLITPFGGFLAGRQYTPAYETSATYDIMGTQSALAAAQIIAFPAAFEIRASNTLSYRIQKDGISGALIYGAGELAGDADKSRLLGINGNYKTDTFSVGFGYNTKNNEVGEKAMTSTVIGASMNFGNSTVKTMLVKLLDDNPANMSFLPAPVQPAYKNAFKQDGTLFHIGYRYVTGPNTISVAYNSFNDNRPTDADVSSYGVAYSYALSKRTDLNAVLVRFDNSSKAQVAPGGNGYIGGVTESAGTDSTGLALGIRHRF